MTSSALLGISTFLYLLISVGFLYMIFFKKQDAEKWLQPAIFLSLLLNLGGWVLRWIETYSFGEGYVPLSNLYESLIALSWCIVITFIILEKKYKTGFLGIFIFPVVSLAMAYASLSPGMNQQIQPLLPALQSNWLTYHVLTCFLAYSAFTISFGASLALLLKIKPGHTKYETLDELIYKANAIGFLLLTMGIITGSIWASRAWGTYWSWDPKETWSLITWIVYAIFLHARLSRGWQGRKAAWFSILGFITVLFTFLGVNYLLSGLHSYM